MAKKGWIMTMGDIRVVRNAQDYKVWLTDLSSPNNSKQIWLSRQQARRLFQQLSGDYKD